jgi:hypothetical protein
MFELARRNYSIAAARSTAAGTAAMLLCSHLAQAA